MFEYSCSTTHLANWVFSQVSNQPGAVFPKRKGWSYFVKSVYPAGSERSILMVMTATNSECVLFIPVDSSVDGTQIRSALKPETLKALRQEFKQVSYQSVLITCERQQERVMRLLDEKDLRSPLLVLNSDRIGFLRGNFENPRLEFRLSQLDYDPDLIPGYFHDNRLHGLETVQKSLFYQNLFHLLNRLWLSAEKSIQLRQLINRSIPCWSYFRRADQKKILAQVHSELTDAFQRYFNGLISLETYQKKAGSQPEEVLNLPVPPDSKKALSAWSKKQKQALAYLNESSKPLSIEELELFIN